VDPAFLELGIPVLGICYGSQEIAWRINPSNVDRGIAREYGEALVSIFKVNSHADRLFAGLGETMNCFMSHFDKLVRLPEDFVIVAKTDNSEFAGIAHKTKSIFGAFPSVNDIASSVSADHLLFRQQVYNSILSLNTYVYGTFLPSAPSYY
jgi:GMP synthase-like glutamine amidotransferase